MNPNEYLAKMALLGDDYAIKEGTVPLWVINVMENLNKSAFKETTYSGIKNLDDPFSKGFFIGLGKFLVQMSKKIELPSLEDQPALEQSVLLTEIQDIFFENKNFYKYSEDQLCEYFSGMKKGKESIVGGDKQSKHSNLTFELSIIMFAYWPFIHEQVHNRRVMYDFFIRILGESRVGEFKRVEKFLQRIGFSPALPGRPISS